VPNGIPAPSPTPLVITVPEQEHALAESEDIHVKICDVVTVIFPLGSIEYLTDNGEDIENLYLYVNCRISVTITQGVSVSVAVNRGGSEFITEVGTPLIYQVNLGSFDLEGINLMRIIAEQEDGTLVRGHVDPETGIFTFETRTIGSFSVLYAPNLRIIGLEIGCYNIMDLIYDSLLLVMEDMTSVIQDNRTLIPLRFVAYVLDASVYWNPDGRLVTIVRGPQVLTFAIGDMAPGMDVPARLMNNRTMVPLRFIAEFFGATANWCGDTRTVEILYR